MPQAEWIEIGTDIPEPLIDVLVVVDFDGDPTIDMGFRKANGEWFLTGSDPLLHCQPTHWMHLPELPLKKRRRARG